MAIRKPVVRINGITQNLPSGDSLTTADVTDSTDKRFVTDAQRTVIGNTSGTNTGDQNLSSYAPLASPTFTGTPAAPTAAAGTSTTQIATTAYVDGSYARSGSVVQSVIAKTAAVATGTTILPWDDTIPQNTEGDQYMTATITPVSSSDILVLEFAGFGGTSVADMISIALFQDSAASALAATCVFCSMGSHPGPLLLRHSMVSGTTNATTFKIRIGPAAGSNTFCLNGQGSTRLFGGVAATSLRITEVRP